VTAAQFRRIALGFADVAESAHMGHPDFRVNGRIFATLSADGRQGMVKLPLDGQARVLRDHPDAFAPASGAWGRQGSTMVQLASADAETVGEAMTIAWQHGVATNAARLPPFARSVRRRPSSRVTGSSRSAKASAERVPAKSLRKKARAPRRR
jgi:hypothetical protein